MIKFVVFDFDGTLVDSRRVFISVYNEIALKQGYGTIEPKNLEYLRELSIKDRLKYLNVPFYKLPFLSAAFLRLYKRSLGELTLQNGIRELLAELEKKGVSVAIISSNSRNNIMRFLELHNMDNVRPVFCSSKIFGKDKVIGRFLRTYGLKREEIVYVGDEVRDIIASKKRGVKVIGVSWGYDKKRMLEAEHPDFIVDKPGEIAGILGTLEGNRIRKITLE